MGIIYYGFSIQCSVCHDSAKNKKKKSFVDILRKNGWCFLIAAATTSNPLFYICEHLWTFSQGVQYFFKLCARGRGGPPIKKMGGRGKGPGGRSVGGVAVL